MHGPRPIRFSARWCADYSKYRGFLAGGISTASSLLPFFGTRLRRQNFNLAPTQYRQLRRLVKAWSEDIEAKLVKFEQSVNNVEKITKEIKRKGMEEEKQAELKFVAQMKEK